MLRRFAAFACALLTTLAAAAQDKLVFATDWLAQAEHGGFYQAVAEGIYAKHGLDVTIRMGDDAINSNETMQNKMIFVNGLRRFYGSIVLLALTRRRK